MSYNLPSQDSTAFVLGQNNIAVLPGDDLNAITSLISTAGGGNIFLEAGTYSMTSDLRLANNVKLKGVGSGITFIDFQNAAYGIKVEGTNDYSTGTVAINTGDISVIGTGTSWDISLVGKSIFLENIWYEITAVPDTQTLTIISPYTGDNLSGETYFISTVIGSVGIEGVSVINSSTDLISIDYAQNILFIDVQPDTGITGIKANHSYVLTFDICFITNCGRGFDIQNTTFVTIDNCNSDNSTSGAGFYLKNVAVATILNSASATSFGDGMTFINVSNFGFDDSSITGSGGNGLTVSGGNAIGILDSFIGSSAGHGILLQASAMGIIASIDNFVGNTGYGIYVSGSSNTDNIFSANVFQTNTAGNFNDTGTNTLIRSNIGVVDN